MAQNTTYQLHLKGFVGGYDFDADYVDYILSKHSGKEVCVLIDSLGGQSNTALSIFSAYKPALVAHTVATIRRARQGRPARLRRKAPAQQPDIDAAQHKAAMLISEAQMQDLLREQERDEYALRLLGHEV